MLIFFFKPNKAKGNTKTTHKQTNKQTITAFKTLPFISVMLFKKKKKKIIYLWSVPIQSGFISVHIFILETFLPYVHIIYFNIFVWHDISYHIKIIHYYFSVHLTNLSHL